MFSSQIRSVHFVGICGTAMASVAAAMQDMGFYVSGSDQNVYPPMSASLAEQRVEVMRSSKGKANPAVVGEILEKKLKG